MTGRASPGTPFDPPLAVSELLKGFPAPWWIAGGWAIDLNLGRVTREHEDVDVSILRRDHGAIRAFLGEDWDFHIVIPRVGSGLRVVWPPGESLEPPIHQTYAVHPAHGELEFLLEESDGDHWVYRRDRRIRRGLDELSTKTSLGLPALATEVVLLFKAKDPRERDLPDLEAALPSLSAGQLAWLRSAIKLAHPDSPFLPTVAGV